MVCSDVYRDGAEFFIKANFGAGTGQIWLDNMNCVGSESSIDRCGRSSWGTHNCNHGEDAGVRCKPSSVPL